MMNRSSSNQTPFTRRLSSTACVLLAAIACGCGGEDAAPQARVVAPPTTPPPPPPPKITPIDELMAQLRIDERVALPESKAPDNDADRKIVLEFYDAFVRSDDQAVGRMISGADRLELEELVSAGSWRDTVSRISRVEIQTGMSPLGQKCALGVFHVGSGFQPQLWYYEELSGEYVFEAAATPPDIMERLSGTDWIAAWHEILDEEIARANEPDEEFEIPQRTFDDEEGSGRSASSPGRRAPTRPPGGPSRRPPKPPRRAPSPF
jgi:hypothetical protein